MDERLVEDWLIKANERSYQVPFAQALIADGMHVLRVGHGSHEHGKDVIALDSRGKVHAYQLKDGDLGLTEWEKGYAQVTALLETQVEHPAIPGKPKHQPYLVISGAASMPVEDRIRVHNSTWKQRGFTPLKLMPGTQLVTKFTQMAASFWPQMPEESRSLFSLYLADGKGSLDRDVFAKLFASIAENKDKPKTEAIRRLSAANLFASYALSPFYGTGNHWEIIQGWTIAAAHIAWAAQEAGLEPIKWQPTFRLAVDEALAAMKLLVDEIISAGVLRPQTGFELDELTRSRNTICAGVLAINALIERHQRHIWQHGVETKKLLEQLVGDGRILLWGESAIPFFLAIVWGLDTMRADQFSDIILIRILFAIAYRNSSPSALKLGSPYESADEANAKVLRRVFHGETAMDYESMDSFTIEPLVTLATRRLWRNALASAWAQITKVQSIQLVPDAPNDLLLWRWGHERGHEQTRLFEKPQSWHELLCAARRNEDDALPNVIKTQFDFTLLFLIWVVPQGRC